MISPSKHIFNGLRTSVQHNLFSGTTFTMLNANLQNSNQLLMSKKKLQVRQSQERTFEGGNHIEDLTTAIEPQ